MNKDQIKTMLLTIGLLNIIAGLAILIFVQPTGAKVSGISCITIGASCFVIYYTKSKEGK